MGEKYVFLNFQTMRVNEKLGVKTLGGIRNICLLTSSFQINEADQSLPCKRWWFKIVRKQRTGGFTVRMSQRQNTKPVKWKESKKRCCVLLCASAADVALWGCCSSSGCCRYWKRSVCCSPRRISPCEMLWQKKNIWVEDHPLWKWTKVKVLSEFTQCPPYPSAQDSFFSYSG